MQVIRTTVRNGRIVVDEPTTLPDGHEVELCVLNDNDDRTHERGGAPKPTTPSRRTTSTRPTSRRRYRISPAARQRSRPHCGSASRRPTVDARAGHLSRCSRRLLAAGLVTVVLSSFAVVAASRA